MWIIRLRFEFWNNVSSIGAYISGAGILVFLYMLFDAFFIYRSKAADNPWGEGATSLEWTLSSPPPFHQFNELPGRDLVDRQAGLTH